MSTTEVFYLRKRMFFCYSITFKCRQNYRIAVIQILCFVNWKMFVIICVCAYLIAKQLFIVKWKIAKYIPFYWCLNKWKRRSLEKFVQSAYLNSQEEVAVLYKILNDCVENNATFPTKETIYKKIHPKQTYNDQQLRLYMSYLFKTIEKFF